MISSESARANPAYTRDWRVPLMPAPNLHFRGPYTICSETSDVLEGCECKTSNGIYLWVVPQHLRGYKVSYLGETSKGFYSRTKEHVIQTLGGNYRVLDADQMRLGIEQIIWDGLWRRRAKDRLPEFLSRYEELAPLVKRYLFGQAVFLAPFEDDSLRRRIEVALALHFRADQNSSILLPRDIQFRNGRKPDEEAVSVTFSADGHIEGLPLELKA